MTGDWHETYKRLSENPDFRSIWEDGPVAERIASLEARSRDIQITDPFEQATIKGQLHALAWLRETLKNPPLPSPTKPAAAAPWTARWRRAVAAPFKSPFLPRPLG